jgi:DHA1 family multidrug resistance protein-like MFS transporter
MNNYQQTSEEHPNWKRNLLLISAAQLITMLGMSAIVPFMPLYVIHLGITNPVQAKLWSGLIFAGPYMLSIFAAPIWGSLGDKYGRKMMISRAVFGLTIALFLMGFTQNVWQLFILRILQGAISGMISAALAFVSADTPISRSGYAIGYLQGSLSAGNIAGPFLGGIISDFGGIRTVFFVVSGLTLISGILVQLFVIEYKDSSISKEVTSIISNLQFALKLPGVSFILLLIILSQAGINFTAPIFPYFVDSLGSPKNLLSTITGSLLAIVGLMTIIFAPIWGRRNDRKDYRKTVMISTFIIGFAIILHIFAPNYIYLFPLRALIGVFFAAIIPTLYATLNRFAPIDHKGGIMGIASSATLFGSLVSFLSCGVISSIFGLNSAFIVSGLLMFSVSFLIWMKNH